MSPDLRDLFDEAGRTPPAAPRWDADDVVRRGARTRNRRRAVSAAATLGVAALVVGGSVALLGPGRTALVAPGDSTPTAQPSPQPTTTPSGLPPSTASGPPASSPAPTPTPTGRACTADDVTLTLGDGGAAAGTAYSVVMIKAKPGIVCDVGGFADVRFDRAVGDPIGPAAESGQPQSHVTVQGGTMASFLVGVARSDNYVASQCLPVTSPSMSVTLPGDSGATTVDLPAGVTVCSGNVSSIGNQLSVTPVVAGPDGQ